MKNPPASPRPRHGRRVGLYLAMVLVSGVIALGLAEIALRLFPIPGIVFHNFYYDPVTGAKYYPGSTYMFRGDDGVLIRRRVNAWGFLDAEHHTGAAPGTLRIAFFGDSYVEAAQVTLEQTFFRLIEDDLDLRASELSGLRTRDGRAVNAVETLAFGVSGRGALQSYLECMNWIDTLGLDYVVYVFVENDPAGQLRELSGDGMLPFPVLAADSFVVDDSFNDRYGYKTSWWHRAMQRIKANSLVVSTIEGRLKLLKAYGVKRKVTTEDREGRATDTVAPMAPSIWPPELVPRGWELQERVTDKWRREVVARGAKFVIMHVPRGNEVLHTPIEQQDSWASRLHTYCAQRGIPLVDPTPVFLKRMDAGEKMFHNHFTPEGHRAFARSFVDYLVADAAAP